MKYHILVCIAVCFVTLVCATEIQIINPSDEVNRVFNLGDDALTFLGLRDTPSTYTGSGGFCTVVNAGGTALEFVPCNVTGDSINATSGSINSSTFSDIWVTSEGQMNDVSDLYPILTGAGFGRNIFDQWLNKTSNVTFHNVSVGGILYASQDTYLNDTIHFGLPQYPRANISTNYLTVPVSALIGHVFQFPRLAQFMAQGYEFDLLDGTTLWNYSNNSIALYKDTIIFADLNISQNLNVNGTIKARDWSNVSGIDLSDDTNLAVTEPIRLTDDTLSLDPLSLIGDVNVDVNSPLTLTAGDPENLRFDTTTALSVSGSWDFTNALVEFAQGIGHHGDTNTKISFGLDSITYWAGGANMISMSYSAFVKQITFNAGGLDFDTIIKGDTDANLLYVDAGEDRVGIGINRPDEKLHVAGNVKIDNNLIVNGNTTIKNLTMSPESYFDWTSYLSVTTTIDSGAQTDPFILFNGSEYVSYSYINNTIPRGISYDPTTGYFTVDNKGTYLFTLDGNYYQASSGSAFLNISVNGERIHYGYWFLHASVPEGRSITMIYDFEAGDVLKSELTETSGTVNANRGTTFTIYRIK